MDMLKDGEGKWVDNAVELKRMALEYYQRLFSIEEREGGHLISSAFPCINAGMKEALVGEVSEEETS